MKPEIEDMVFFLNHQICGFKSLEIFFKILEITFKFILKMKNSQKMKNILLP